jgi:hypothetical protein
MKQVVTAGSEAFQVQANMVKHLENSGFFSREVLREANPTIGMLALICASIPGADWVAKSKYQRAMMHALGIWLDTDLDNHDDQAYGGFSDEDDGGLQGGVEEAPRAGFMPMPPMPPIPAMPPLQPFQEEDEVVEVHQASGPPAKRPRKDSVKVREAKAGE